VAASLGLTSGHQLVDLSVLATRVLRPEPSAGVVGVTALPLLVTNLPRHAHAVEVRPAAAADGTRSQRCALGSPCSIPNLASQPTSCSAGRRGVATALDGPHQSVSRQLRAGAPAAFVVSRLFAGIEG
jgi:hypothetical protein